MAALPESDAAFARAFRLHQQGRLREALDGYHAVLAAMPAHAPALHYSGLLLHQAGQSAAAAQRMEQSLRTDPGPADAWSNLALVYQALGRPDAAIAALEQATQRAPADAALWENLAGTLLEAGRFSAAEAAARRAVGLGPQAPGAWFNLALALRERGQVREALGAITRALARAPDAVPAIGLQAQLQEDEGDLAAARRTLEAALSPAPGHVPLRLQLASLLERSGELGAAADAYAQIDPASDPQGLALSQCLFLRKRLADWHDLATLRQRFRAGVAARQPLLSPFCLLSDPASRALHRQCAQTWVDGLQLEPASEAERVQGAGTGRRPAAGDRLTIGYLAADFHMHATALLAAGLFECHDRGRYRVIAYSTGPDDRSALRMRVMAAFDRFVDARGWPAARLADAIRADGVDILVDLKGHTEGASTAVLARRPAPLQVAYLGYPGTTGAPFIDYLIGDAIVTPLAHAADYTETLIQLPGCYQVNDRSRRGVVPPSRSALGLPETGPVLCCFNNAYKINPEVLDAWAHILREVPAAVLWLLVRDDRDPVAGNLRREAQRRGIEAHRLVFATSRPNDAYLGLYRHATLFLDTWPYNGHTTASDALWEGCPVVTWCGETFAGRVGASLLRAIGLAELINENVDGYVATAIALARDPSRARALRAYLEGAGRASPLFDVARTTRAIERAFDAMVAQAASGERAPIVIGPES